MYFKKLGHTNNLSLGYWHPTNVFFYIYNPTIGKQNILFLVSFEDPNYHNCFTNLLFSSSLFKTEQKSSPTFCTPRRNWIRWTWKLKYPTESRESLSPLIQFFFWHTNVDVTKGLSITWANKSRASQTMIMFIGPNNYFQSRDKSPTTLHKSPLVHDINPCQKKTVSSTKPNSLLLKSKSRADISPSQPFPLSFYFIFLFFCFSITRTGPDNYQDQIG